MDPNARSCANAARGRTAQQAIDHAMMHRGRIARIVVSVLVPPAGALAAIHVDPIGNLAVQRPGVIALGVLTVALAMHFNQLRSLLVITLSFGAAVLAARGSFWSQHSVPKELATWLAVLYPAGWYSLLLLGTMAGVLEYLRPGTVMAKRCLFAAAAVFLIGHGTIGVVVDPNLLSVTALIAGLGSLLGAVWCHRLTVAPEEQVPDVLSSSALAMERRIRLRRTEWVDRA